MATETLNQRNNVLLLPTVTSFIQALPAGEPFRISVHSWENPEPSRYAHNVTKQPDLIMFEARVLVDGRLVGYVLYYLSSLQSIINNKLTGRKYLDVRDHGLPLLKLVSVRITAS